MSSSSPAHHPRRDGFLRLLAVALPIYLLAGGATSFLGWVADLQPLTDWAGNGISIQPNTTLNVMLAGTALLLLARGRFRPAAVCGVVVATIGASALFQYLSGVELGIDTLLMFDRTWGRVGVIAPGRMGPSGATSWTLIGTALVLCSAPTGSRQRAIALVLAIATTLWSALSLIGYLYGASPLYTIPTLTVIAFQTATFVCAASVGLLVHIRERGPMLLLGDPGPAGVLMRRLVPALIVVPVLLGALRLAGARAGFFDAAFGTALRTICEIAIFLGVVWWISSALARATRAVGESEQRYRSLVAVVTDVPWTTDAGGAFTEGQPAWTAYTGQDEAALGGYGWLQAIHPEDRAAVQELWQQARATGTTYRSSGRLWHAPSGQWRWVSARATPLLATDGAIRGWVGAFTDVDEQQRLAAEREQVIERERMAREQAERVVQLKDEFLATLSHELRTPLNAILGWTHILEKDLGDRAKAAYALEVLKRNGRLQAQLIADILDLSRIVSGKMRLEVKPIDLREVVGHAVESIRPAAEAKQIAISVAAPAAVTINGDAARLQQVVWNLLSNAVKFSAKGGRVQVVLERTQEHVSVLVADNGEGIDPGFLPHLFERFRQADSSTSRTQGGLGIGLALVKQLVELHGGTVRAQSEGKGTGASFLIELPLQVRTDQQPPRPQPDASGTPWPGEATKLDGVRVLLVEDEPDALAMTRRILEESEAEVLTAGSSAQALEILRVERFDVIVSDIGMPGLDGYSFLQEARRLGIATPAVALTAFARLEDRARAIQSGYLAHLSKPLDGNELLGLVGAITGRPKAPSATSSGGAR